MAVEKQEMVNFKHDSSQFQFLRFIAFSLIFLWHVDCWSYSWFPKGLGAALAVSFFFVLSGFCTGFSGYLKEEKPTIKNIFNYVLKKILKFYPLLLVTTLIWFFIIDGGNGNEKQLLKNLFLIQSWFKNGFFSLNGVTWFLSTIIFIYLFKVPFLYLLCLINKSRKKYIYLISLVLCISTFLILYFYLTNDINNQYYHYIFPPARLFEYLLGSTIGFLTKSLMVDKKSAQYNNKRTIFTVLEVFGILFWISTVYIVNYFNKFSFTVYWIIPNIVLLIIFSFGRGYVSQLFRLKPFKFLGDLSFECFIIHCLSNKLYLKCIVINGRFIISSGILNILLSLILVLIIALIYNLLKRFISSKIKTLKIRNFQKNKDSV